MAQLDEAAESYPASYEGSSPFVCTILLGDSLSSKASKKCILILLYKAIYPNLEEEAVSNAVQSEFESQDGYI